jgi:hypothetical protein
MAQTPAYCTDCYNKAVKSGSPDDAQLLAAERAGRIPMTKQDVCSKFGKSTVVMYFDA